MPDAPRSDAPFFILGAHGSGSTLLRLMLDSHERLAVPHETGVMRLVTAHRWVPFWVFGGEWHEHLGLSEDELEQRLGGFYGEMFARYAGAQGKQRWGEKTPFHIWHVDEIRRVFPGAVFIAIVRHPLSSIGSAIRRFDQPLPRAVEHWVNSSRELVRQAVAADGDLSFLRYEDLVSEAGSTMRELLGWLGEQWSDQVLAHHEVQARRGARVVEGGTRPADAVDPSRMQRWRRWVDAEQRAYVDERTGGWARVFGYGPEPTDALEQLSLAGGNRRFVAEAADVVRRLDAVPGLDLTAPPRPRADDPLLPRGRRREQALRRADPGRNRIAHEVFERLPPSLQRSLRDARRRGR